MWCVTAVKLRLQNRDLLHLSYRQQVQAILVQVFHHGRQVARLPFREGVLVVRQALHIRPNIVVWRSQSPEETRGENLREDRENLWLNGNTKPSQFSDKTQNDSGLKDA